MILTFAEVDIIVIVHISTPSRILQPPSPVSWPDSVSCSTQRNCQLWLPYITAPNEKQKIIVVPKLRTEDKVPSKITFSKTYMIFKAFNVVQCYNYYVYPEHFKNFNNNVFKTWILVMSCVHFILACLSLCKINNCNIWSTAFICFVKLKTWWFQEKSDKRWYKFIHQMMKYFMVTIAKY